MSFQKVSDLYHCFKRYPFFIAEPLLSAKRETARWIITLLSICIFVNIKILSIIGGRGTTLPPSVAREDAIISVLYWRKCTGVDVNTMEHGMLFVVNAVVPIISTTSLSPLNSPASRIIHSSFDLDGRHSTASHSSSCTSTSVEPKLFLHLHQSRALFILRGKRSALEILFHLASPGNSNYQVYRQYPFTRGARATTTLLRTRRSSERIATLINQSRRARDKSPRVIY